MLCSRKILILTGGAIVVCGSLLVTSALGKNEKEKGKEKEKEKPKAAQAAKPEKKGDDKKAEGKKSADASSDEQKHPSKLVIPLPKGQDSKGVTIPIPYASGKKNMVFKIGVGTRIDDNHVKMSDLLIETYSEVGEQEITVAMPSSTLDLSTRTIAGDQGVTIDRSDFQITGKNMEFNTETRKGWIEGNVKMIIYNLNTTGAAPTPGASEAASPNSNPTGS
jgi:hypothetical protein